LPKEKKEKKKKPGRAMTVVPSSLETNSGCI